MRSGLKSNPPRSLQFFTGLLPINQFDFSKHSQQEAKSQPTTQCSVDWHPLPGPQTVAYNYGVTEDQPVDIDEIFYGGSAGGGKSDLGLGLAATKHKRSLILRREYTQLRGIIERSRDIIGTAGKFNEVNGVWRLPNRLIEFGGCQLEGDKRKYQGRPHDLLMFDEAPEFLESQVNFLSGWARTENPKQHVLILLTGNPPTSAEGQWIIKRYAPWLDEHHPLFPYEPGKPLWFARIAGEDILVEGPESFEHEDETITPLSRTFIPARVDDNPYYRDSGYKAQLQSLPEPLRSQMLYGDFTVGLDDDPWQIIPTEWVRQAQQRWRDAKKPQPVADSIGVDVARGGRDKTIIARRYGCWVDELIKHPGQFTPDGPAVAALAIQALESYDTTITVDVIGVGSSVYDSLLAMDGLSIYGFNGAHKSKATDRTGKLGMVNKRAEVWWRMREMLEPTSADQICLPPDSELLGDLCAPHWKLTVRGVQVEDKDDVKKRIGRSPDAGDAVLMAFHGVESIGLVDLENMELAKEELDEKDEYERELEMLMNDEGWN